MSRFFSTSLYHFPFPTRVTEIRDVAAAGEKMPQKSTYFYPKMITGMVMNDIGVE